MLPRLTVKQQLLYRQKMVQRLKITKISVQIIKVQLERQAKQQTLPTTTTTIQTVGSSSRHTYQIEFYVNSVPYILCNCRQRGGN